jgi:type VI secretion system protein ImpE
MNEAKLQLDAGNLGGAVDHAIHLVKTNPTSDAGRIFLFELSCFSGDWDRADRQLEVIGHQDVSAMVGSKIYQQNLKAERDRMKYFSDGLVPEFLTAKPAHIDGLISANNRIREGNSTEARQILDEVEEQRPAFPCKVNGEEYSDFRDYNDLTMCVLEALHKDTYVWVPFEHVTRIEFFKPKTLRDLYWIQAKVDLASGLGGEMFIPALYSGSWKSSNDQVRLGRMTDWRDLGGDTFVGEGTRLFWMDGKDKSILDIETIEFLRDESESQEI